MRLAIWSMLVVIATFKPAFSEDFTVQERQITAPGAVKLLSGWACWFADCSFANCRMQTTKKPRLGTLNIEVKSTTISADLSKTCAGRPTPGLYITYTPRAGAHGADAVELRSIADNGKKHLLRYSITVP